MTWTLDADRPIYAQLVDRIRIQIVSGQYPPGSRLPSVRELAAQASVNPNTMQRAFGELERSGLVVTQRTFGRIWRGRICRSILTGWAALDIPGRKSGRF